MTRLVAILATPAVASALACTSDPALDFDAVPTTPLSVRILTEFPAQALLRDVELLPEHLAVLDVSRAGAVHLIDPSTGEVTGSARQPVREEGALMTSVHLEAPAGWSGQPAWLYDVRGPRVVELPLDSLLRGMLNGPSRTLDVRGTPTEVRRLNDSLWAAPGFLRDGRIALIDPEGRGIGWLGNVPGEERDVPVEARQQLYQAALGIRPDGQMAVLVNRHFGAIELYATDGSVSREAQGPFSFQPRYRLVDVEGDSVIQTGSGLRFGYLDVAVTNDAIFALFSGKSREEAEETASHGEYVHVFNWDGSFCHAFQFDVGLTSLAIDTEGQTLYGVRHYPRPAVVALELPAGDGEDCERSSSSSQ